MAEKILTKVSPLVMISFLTRIVLLLTAFLNVLPSLAQSSTGQFVYPPLSGPAVTFKNKDTVPIRWVANYQTISLLLHVDGQQTYYQILDTQPNTKSYDFYVGDNLVNNQGLSYHFELIGVDSSGNIIGDEYFDSGSFIVAAASSAASSTTTPQAVTITATEQVTTTITPSTTALSTTPISIPTPTTLSTTAAAQVTSSTTATFESSTSNNGVVVITVSGTAPASTSVAVQTTNGASSSRFDLANVVFGLLVGCIWFIVA